MKFHKIFLSFLFFLWLILPFAHAQEVLTWEECLKKAAQNNPDLVSAQETVNQSRATEATTTSGLFPQVTASTAASGTRTKIDDEDATGSSYAVGLSGSQLIFDGFKTQNNVKAAKQNVTAAEQSYHFASAGVRLNLRTAFINLLKAQQMLRVTEEILDIRKNEMIYISLQYESGLEHKGALLNSEASMAQAKFENDQAKRNLELMQRQLIKEMGLTDFVPMQVQGDFAISTNIQEKQDFTVLAEQHPSFKQAVAKKNAAEFDLKVAEGDYYPKVTLDAAANRNGADFFPRDDRLSAGATVSLPIFEGGSRKAEKLKAESLLRQTEAQQRSKRDEIIFDLPEAWKQLLDAVESVDVKQKMLTAAEERSKIAEMQYAVGFIAYDNWTIIQDNLIQAKKAFVDAQANALLSEANWVYAKGETLEYAQEK